MKAGMLSFAVAALAVVQLLLPVPARATRAIVACDPIVWECGVAVVTNPYGGNYVVPQGHPNMAVDNQYYPDKAVGEAFIRNVESGMSAGEALDTALALASWGDWLQIGAAVLVDYPGSCEPDWSKCVEVAAYTGAGVQTDPPDSFCQLVGPTYVVSADAQTSAAVCRAMAQGYVASAGRTLPRRLLAALEAGTPVGHDLRGEYSAGIRTYSWWYWPYMSEMVMADVPGSLHWEEDLRWALELWLANWEIPEIWVPREYVPLTDKTMRETLLQLRRLGYYHGPLGSGWTDEAEQALLSWELIQFGSASADGQNRPVMDV